MAFTYTALERLVSLLREGGYRISTYHDYPADGRCVILRHDVDYDPSKALELARREASWGVSSTYFFLVSSPLYNALSKECSEIIHEIVALGHEVGLHFDEAKYSRLNSMPEATIDAIRREAEVLSLVSGVEVQSVSMHRPSKTTLEANLRIPGITNSYGNEFFHGFKYLSDSRRRWREPVEEIVQSGEYEKLHILTHAFWYADDESDIHDAVSSFINGACRRRYADLSDNISNIEEIMPIEEVL